MVCAACRKPWARCVYFSIFMSTPIPLSARRPLVRLGGAAENVLSASKHGRGRRRSNEPPASLMWCGIWGTQGSGHVVGNDSGPVALTGRASPEGAPAMSPTSADPRSEAEKARVDLKRNTEMGTAVSESPLEHQPSVTPDRFGVHDKTARIRSGS